MRLTSCATHESGLCLIGINHDILFIKIVNIYTYSTYDREVKIKSHARERPLSNNSDPQTRPRRRNDF